MNVLRKRTVDDINVDDHMFYMQKKRKFESIHEGKSIFDNNEGVMTVVDSSNENSKPNLNFPFRVSKKRFRDTEANIVFNVNNDNSNQHLLQHMAKSQNDYSKDDLGNGSRRVPIYSQMHLDSVNNHLLQQQQEKVNLQNELNRHEKINGSLIIKLNEVSKCKENALKENKLLKNGINTLHNRNLNLDKELTQMKMNYQELLRKYNQLEAMLQLKNNLVGSCRKDSNFDGFNNNNDVF